MSTKKCSKCGWEYPLDWPGRRCKFCNEPFKDGICSICGEYYPKLHNGMCQPCITIQHRAWRHGRVNDADALFKDWLNMIGKLPYPYQTLNEEQWMEACKHFGGCAYCGKDSIDVRSMFIKFKNGGRYCNWNIIPACEQCENALKLTDNPFIRMDQKYKRGNSTQAKKLGFNLDNLQRIVDYLQSKMEALNENM